MSLIFRENIRHLIEQMDVSISEFAEKIGEKSSRLNDVLQGKQRPPFDLIEKILTNLDIDANWLITGKGSSGINPTNNSKKNQEVDIDSEFALIPFYEAEISAGFGYINDNHIPSKHLAFRKDWLKTKRLPEKDLVAATATGDSMGATVPNGCTMLIDTSQTNPRDGSIYVIRSSDTFWVKRIQRQLDGTLLLISDNEAYPSMNLDLREHENVQIIGQVVYVSKDVY